MKKYLFVLIVGVMLSGCSSAGPYVTNISSDGRGNLIIEKQTVRWNWWTSSISNGDQTISQSIKVLPDNNSK